MSQYPSRPFPLHSALSLLLVLCVVSPPCAAFHVTTLSPPLSPSLSRVKSLREQCSTLEQVEVVARRPPPRHTDCSALMLGGPPFRGGATRPKTRSHYLVLGRSQPDPEWMSSRFSPHQKKWLVGLWSSHEYLYYPGGACTIPGDNADDWTTEMRTWNVELFWKLLGRCLCDIRKTSPGHNKK